MGLPNKSPQERNPTRTTTHHPELRAPDPVVLPGYISYNLCRKTPLMTLLSSPQNLGSRNSKNDQFPVLKTTFRSMASPAHLELGNLFLVCFRAP